MVFSCASGGGKGEAIGPGVPAVGDPEHAGDYPVVDGWTYQLDEGDGGSSTCTMTVIEIDGLQAFNFVGYTTTAAQWPYVNFEFYPDAATVDNFRSAKAISFMVKGDGREYFFNYQISSVTDWAWHRFAFRAPAEATRITIRMDQFMQPSWGTWRRMDQTRFMSAGWCTSSWAYDSPQANYEITLWDLQIHL